MFELPVTQKAPLRVPPEAGEGRLILASMLDSAIAVGGGIGLVQGTLGHSLIEMIFVPLVFACGLGTSFVNQVLGAWIFRGSLGKLLFGMRVVRARDGRRAGFWRSIWRWISGFAMIVIMVMVEDGGGVGELCGLRTIRRRDEQR